MTKEKKETPKLTSWNDFDDDLLNNTESEQEQEVEESEEEQEEVEIKFKAKKKKPTAKQPAEESEEETEETEEEEVEEKPKEKAKVVEKPKVELETEEVETEEEPEDDSEYASKFFSEVQRLTGNEVDVDYGDIDPLSPEGVALREKAVKELTLDNFIKELEERYPKTYQSLTYESNGGDPADLFKVATGRDYGNITLGETDTALSKEILKEYYQLHGVKSEAKIAKLVEVAEDSEIGLVKEAQEALEELKKDQEDKRAELLDKADKAKSEQKRRDQVFVTSLDEVLETRKLGNFKLGDKVEATEFKKFVLGNVRRTEDGKYTVAALIEPNNMEEVLKYQYFLWKKGDLSKIIQQAATSLNAQKLSLRLKGEQQKLKKNSQQEQLEKLSLKDF